MSANGARALQSRSAVSTRRPAAARPVFARAKKESKGKKDDSGHEQVYIGQGRYVTDDPKKYPSKDSWGTGGWAGGEEGLQKFLEKAAKEGYDDSNDETPTGPATKLLGGKDVIYTGQGNYVRDNKERYPSKDSLGVGGFAGGERGVEKYVSDGELEFDKDNKQPFSPLVAGLAMSATAILVSSIWVTVAGNFK